MMDNKLALMSAVAVIAITFAVAALFVSIAEKPQAQLEGAGRFSSYEELAGFVKSGMEDASGGYYRGGDKVMATTTMAEAATAPAAAAQDYSETNVQVAGVDEADIVKNDGRYIYAVTGNRLVIVDAYPAENARLASETELEGYPVEIFVNRDRLIVFANDYGYDAPVVAAEKMSIARPAIAADMPFYYNPGKTRIDVYDISDREAPRLARSVSVTGSYFDSRMIGDYAYAVVNEPVYYYDGPRPVPLPVIMEGGVNKTVAAEDIYYFGVPDYGYTYVNIISLNTQNDEDYRSKTFLSGSAQNIYVSAENIYVSYTKWANYWPVREGNESETEKTIIHRIGISNGAVNYEVEGSVPGHVLNQFSMDEHNGYLRIATTTGQAWNGQSKNNVYVLDDSLDAVGAVENLAPGESIYSARFLGNRAYMVTFKKVDPLFVLDLSEPANPRVLGKLKIPGYSDYLHPYDENHIIGIGKEAVEAEEGDFAWYQGLKLALFDVSNPESPVEVSKYEIGDRGTDSYALHDHKAFLFSREKGLLVIPVLLAEIDESRYAGKLPPHAYGDFTWQGAYVFGLDTEKGFELKGRITHLDSEEGREELLKSGYYFDSAYDVKRSLYMDDVLYTVSDRMVKANNLEGLGEIRAVRLD